MLRVRGGRAASARGCSGAGDGPGRRNGAFTLIELLVVMTIIMTLAGMLTAAIFTVRVKVLMNAAKVDIKTFTMALATYRRELGAYPPDDDIWETGWDPQYGMNEVLVHYLGGKHKKGANYYGPWIHFKQGRLSDADADGFDEYRDPFGNLYMYAENLSATVATGTRVGKNPRSYDIVCAGPDQILGGTMTAVDGYGSVGDPAEADNITNWSK